MQEQDDDQDSLKMKGNDVTSGALEGYKFMQTKSESPYGLAGAGGPALPSPQPKVRGEHQWTTNANNINDWSDNQTDVANTRIPYASTLM